MINDDILFLIKATMFVLFLNLLLWPHPVDESQNHSQIGPVDTEMTGLKATDRLHQYSVGLFNLSTNENLYS